MSKHTPGPWASMPDREQIIGGDGNIVVYETNTNPADTLLICAAPDLLSALQACYDMIAEECADGEYTEQARLARAAILKATGEPA